MDITAVKMNIPEIFRLKSSKLVDEQNFVFKIKIVRTSKYQSTAFQ